MKINNNIVKIHNNMTGANQLKPGNNIKYGKCPSDASFEGRQTYNNASVPCWAYSSAVMFSGNKYGLNGIDFKKLEQAGIENLRQISNNSVRGITLSGKKNRHLLRTIREAGIKKVIDLRGLDSSKDYKEACERSGLKYYNFPIFQDTKAGERAFIEKMPEMFKVLDEGNSYIACAQGLHRTDIFLALNYLFNPKAPEIPRMWGHISGGNFKYDDIFKKANSVFKNMGTEDKINLGLGEQFDEKAFKDKKAKLLDANSAFAKSLIG